jgi:hypothetical protein
VLLAALDGVRQAGFPVEIDGCDLTERRMYVRVVCEQVQVMAPALLAGYRSPFTGASGAANPVVFAGFVLTNSETGCGAFTLTPRLVVQVCRNGMTITRDAVRAVHLGERMDEGVVTWSGNTQDKTLALVTAKTTDAVTTFLDPAYAERAVRAIEKDAGHPVTDPQAAVETVSQRLRFTDAQQNDILAFTERPWRACHVWVRLSRRVRTVLYRSCRFGVPSRVCPWRWHARRADSR